MNHNLTPRFGICSGRLLLILLLCAAACCAALGNVPNFVHAGNSADVSQRTLTFAERVVYQRIIDDVYWRHRIWPKEDFNPKPPLNAAMLGALGNVTDLPGQSARAGEPLETLR
jgi:hypothetical protein